MPRSLAITFLFFCLLNYAAAQPLRAGYAHYGSERLSPRELSEQLTAGRSSEYDKVRSIFDWITENIYYRSNLVSRRNASAITMDDDTSATLKPLNERVSEIVLRNRLAVCDGYARLFKTLCDHAGIRAEIVTGFVRNTNRNSAKFQTNHSWNAVRIDGKWYLADATWASGYVNFSGQFIQQYDRNYFLPDPGSMLQTHYPENPFWTLMTDHRTPGEFNSQPLKYFGWHGAYIENYAPRSGIIIVQPGKPVTITLETKEKKQDLILTTDPFHLLPFYTPANWQRNYLAESLKITGTWLPGNDKPKWLYVVFNGEVIMRYSLRYN